MVRNNYLKSSETEDLQKQFFHSLCLGTGRAMLLMKAHPQIDFSKELIAASIKNLANDPQSEGSRAKYLYPLIRRSKKRALIKKKVLQKLENKKFGTWDLDQLCELALLFYKGGNALARDIFLERFEKSFQDDYDFCGHKEILEMIGLQGLFKLAEKIGRLPEEEWSYYEYRWYIDDFQKANPALDVYKELEKAAKENAYIQNYFKLISAAEPFKRTRRKTPSAYTISDIEDIVDHPRIRARFGSIRSQKMKKSEINQIATNFLQEKDKLRKLKYLRFFHAVKFSFDYAPLLKIASGRINYQTRAVQNSAEALSRFSGDDIRALAMKKFATDRVPCDYLPLLINNYQDGDAEIFLSVISRAKNFDEVHSFIHALIDIYEANPGPDCKLP
ncbi:MAG: hypothetical protein WA071_12200 [Undibacterium umbellatum]|uniref:hypothetical protein n=1 Tax=Undibacterium umbellatum TaxID=2762300 RepID=UPI003BB5D489